MKLEKLLHELKRYLNKGDKDSQTKYDQTNELLRQFKGKTPFEAAPGKGKACNSRCSMIHTIGGYA